jgi:hypothetical protein
MNKDSGAKNKNNFVGILEHIKSCVILIKFNYLKNYKIKNSRNQNPAIHSEQVQPSLGFFSKR